MRMRTAGLCLLIVLAGRTFAYGEPAKDRDSDFARKLLEKYCIVSDDEEMWERLLRQVRKFGERERRALLGVSNPENPDRVCAWRYLTFLKDKRVIPLLRQAVADPKQESIWRAQAIEHLGKLNDVESLGQIIAFLHVDDDELVGAAIIALGRINDQRARDVLREALGDERLKAWRSWVIQAIGQQRDEKALPLLLELASRVRTDGEGLEAAKKSSMPDEPEERQQAVARDLDDK